MAFTNDQLAVAIEEVSGRFFVTNDEGLLSNRVLRRLFENLVKDVRANRPPGTNFCALAKLARDFETVTSSMGNIPKRLAKRLSGNPVRTAIDGTVVELEFFGPDAKHRRRSGTETNDKRLYLEFRCEAVQPLDAAHASLPSSSDRDTAPPVSVVSGADSDALTILRDLPVRIADQLSRIQQPARKPWETPPPPFDLAGRERELSEIANALAAGTTNVFALQGPSGIGKTVLGLAAVAQLRDRFGASIYFDLRGNTRQPLTSADALRHVARAFSPAATIPDSIPELKALYQSILHETRTVLFFENIATAAQINDLAPPRGCLLIASSVLRLTSPSMLAVHLRPLEPASSVPFVAHVAPRAASLASHIVDLCGHYPIALRAAAHAIAEYPTISVESYIQRLRDTSTRLSLIDPTTDKSVEAVIEVSYSLLPLELQQRFAALAVFPATFDQQAAAAVWRCTAADAVDALSALYRLSLIEFEPTANRYHLHDLLNAFARARLHTTVADTLERRFARHYRHILCTRGWEAGSTPQRSAREILALELPNIQKVHDQAVAADTPSAARFLATFQWPEMRAAPIARAAATSWLLSGTRYGESSRQRRVAAVNITRLALQYARIDDVHKSLQELKRLPAYIERFDDVIAIQNILLTLRALARVEPRFRDCILEFLLQFAQSPNQSLTHGALLTAMAAIYNDMDLHAQARDFAARARATESGDVGRLTFDVSVYRLSWTRQLELNLPGGGVLGGRGRRQGPTDRGA